MTDAFPHFPAVWSHGLALLVFLAFTVQVVASGRVNARASVLLAALTASAVWAGAEWLALEVVGAETWLAAALSDAFRIGAWLVFLQLLLADWEVVRFSRSRAITFAQFAVAPALLISSTLLLPLPAPWASTSAGASHVGYYVLLGAAVFGLVLSERLFRQSPVNRRWAIKPLVIGLAGMFAYDLVLYSGAILFGQVSGAMWAARGLTNAMAVIFVAIATARNMAWTIELHVSRDVVYRSTALLFAGAYLLLVSFAGYWVHLFGGDWGGTLQTAFIFGASLLLLALLLSGRLRAWFKVFVGKNLFSYRYDYRTEWLRFTRLLGTAEQGENLYQQVIRAMANLVESIGGSLWLVEEGHYAQVARINAAPVQVSEPMDSSLAAFLHKTDWVIQVDDARESVLNHPGLQLPDWLAEPSDAWLVIPLPSGGELIGFVVLTHPRTRVEVNWEVRDLLKTAGRQAAAYISQIRAKEALVESEKFDAFNRMSAFVVHDLKNLVAQLALLLRNSERHKDNPEFQQDVLATVEHAVNRMNQLMLQLRTGTMPTEKPRPVDIGGILERILTAKGVPQAQTESVKSVDRRVLSHEDRLERVIGHVIQNALDACAGDATKVSIRVGSEGDFATIAIADQGEGMTAEFLRERLFHPFQTTKTQGMGIGMYESFQYLNSIGGRIAAESQLGRGSRFCVYLPLANPAIQSTT